MLAATEVLARGIGEVIQRMGRNALPHNPQDLALEAAFQPVRMPIPRRPDRLLPMSKSNVNPSKTFKPTKA